MGGVDRSILTLGYEVEPRSKMTDIHPLTISIIFELKFMLESQRSTKDKDDTLRRFMIGDCDPSIDLPPLAYVDRPALFRLHCTFVLVNRPPVLVCRAINYQTRPCIGLQ